MRNVLLALLSSLAKVEAQRISARTKAGLDRARAQEQKLGRPPLPQATRAKVEKLRRTDPDRSIRSIAKELKLPFETVRLVLRPKKKDGKVISL